MLSSKIRQFNISKLAISNMLLIQNVNHITIDSKRTPRRPRIKVLPELSSL